ncbi:MAG: hypothetical protein WC802_00235 [Patescibacteria group bacterium]|jgi:hypothetical protein
MEEIKFLILTIIVELPVALLFLRKEDWRRVAFVVLGVNMISHPIVWQLIFYHQVNWFMAEFGVAVFEGLVFAVIFRDRRVLAALAAVSMNVFSAAIGYICF